MEVWYILCPRDSKAPSNVDVVKCEESDKIANFRQRVLLSNPSRLVGIDASQLDVTEDGQDETICDGRKKLSYYENAGKEEHPFIILYQPGQGNLLGATS